MIARSDPNQLALEALQRLLEESDANARDERLRTRGAGFDVFRSQPNIEAAEPGISPSNANSAASTSFSTSSTTRK